MRTTKSVLARPPKEPDLFSYLAPDAEQVDRAPVAFGVADKPAPATFPAAPLVPVFVDHPLLAPLADEAFAWFRAHEKTWDLRRRGRQFNESEVVIGRTVELRGGSRSSPVLTGRIEQVVQAATVEAFFEIVPYHGVIPTADSVNDAVAIAKRLLGAGTPAPLIGFRIAIDNDESDESESQVSPSSAGKRAARGR